MCCVVGKVLPSRAKYNWFNIQLTILHTWRMVFYHDTRFVSYPYLDISPLHSQSLTDTLWGSVQWSQPVQQEPDWVPGRDHRDETQTEDHVPSDWPTQGGDCSQGMEDSLYQCVIAIILETLWGGYMHCCLYTIILLTLPLSSSFPLPFPLFLTSLFPLLPTLPPPLPFVSLFLFLTSQEAGLVKSNMDLVHVEREKESLSAELSTRKQELEMTRQLMENQRAEERKLRKIIAEASSERSRQKKELEQASEVYTYLDSLLFVIVCTLVPSSVLPHVVVHIVCFFLVIWNSVDHKKQYIQTYILKLLFNSVLTCIANIHCQ